jgi:hypothetical protein
VQTTINHYYPDDWNTAAEHLDQFATHRNQTDRKRISKSGQ